MSNRSRRRQQKRVAPLSNRISPNTGRIKFFSDEQLHSIHDATLQILETIGLSDAPQEAIRLIRDNGGKVTDSGRLTFPPNLVNEAISKLRKNFILHARVNDQSLDLSEYKVHTGTGGAAPMIADMSTHTFRQSVLDDLYDASRLVDKLDNIHFFARPMVANDMSTSIMLDINTAYASLVGTSKHVISSISAVSNVKTVHQLCSIIAGSDKNFFDKPFMSLNVNHVVPPLRFDTESCEVLIEASRFGFPVMVNTFGQMGASSPVTIAGCLVQTNAETLAGMVLAWLANKDVNAIYGARPMVTDLRTGGMAGGSGEQSLLTAAAVQLAQYYNFPNSTISGATDSKLPDNQAGYEKAINLTLAVQTGANLITQAAGTQAGLMATSLEAYVIDNEMLGAILSTGKQIEVNEETCSVEAIKKKNSVSKFKIRIKYMSTWPAIIDLLAVLSGLIPMIFEIDLRILRALRMLRLLKFSRYFKVMNLLLGVLKEERQSFLAAMFLLTIAMLIASTGIYIFEKDAQPDKFGSIPEAMWWAVATLTTVGYGDVTPITAMGKIFGALITIIGIGTVALPSGILASGFSDQLKRRKNTYENELSLAMQDGIITEKERNKLEKIAEDMNLSVDQIKIMEKRLKES